MKNCCQNIEDLKSIEKLVDFLQVIAESNRLKILCLLSSGTKCVCEIEEQLLLKQNLVSHHLKVLKDAELVVFTKQGQWRYYSLNKKNITNLKNLFKQIFSKKDLKKSITC